MSEIELFRDENPKFTQKRIDCHFEYWDHFNPPGLQRPSLDDMKNNIGKPLGNAKTQYIQIHHNGEHVGDIVVQPANVPDPKCMEIDISIFKQFQGNRYSSQALKKFLDHWEQNNINKIPLEATVYEHSDREKIVNLLESNGFSIVEQALDGSKVIFHYLGTKTW